MGQEIDNTQFSQHDFTEFRSRLEHETQILSSWVDEGKVANDHLVGGFEVESWLLDSSMLPAPCNDAFIKAFNNSLAVPELAQFNLEFNNTPIPLRELPFTYFYDELTRLWHQAELAANSLSPPASLLMIGTLPTLKLSDLSEQTMSDMKRYHALNEQIMKRRKDKPIHVDIQGKDHLELGSDNVMLEASTTSFQIHTQVPVRNAHHYYNASLAISAAMLALSANSPYVFGKDLWYETRIPLFEQAIDTANHQAPINRVSFGSHFLQHSILECFHENLDHFHILLPILEDHSDTLKHLRLHNGTIWRWNRPLLGFDHEKIPHIRIEHRAMPAGPTIKDMIANAAVFYGLLEFWAQKFMDGHRLPCFNESKNNFYNMAKYGMEVPIEWYGTSTSAQTLILDTLLPQARQGLQQLGIITQDINYFLTIIEERVAKKQTGSEWQRQFISKYNCPMSELTRTYQQFQKTETPVHTWSI